MEVGQEVVPGMRLRAICRGHQGTIDVSSGSPAGDSSLRPPECDYVAPSETSVTILDKSEFTMSDRNVAVARRDTNTRPLAISRHRVSNLLWGRNHAAAPVVQV